MWFHSNMRACKRANSRNHWIYTFKGYRIYKMRDLFLWDFRETNLGRLAMEFRPMAAHSMDWSETFVTWMYWHEDGRYIIVWLQFHPTWTGHFMSPNQDAWICLSLSWMPSHITFFSMYIIGFIIYFSSLGRLLFLLCLTLLHISIYSSFLQNTLGVCGVACNKGMMKYRDEMEKPTFIDHEFFCLASQLYGECKNVCE